MRRLALTAVGFAASAGALYFVARSVDLGAVAQAIGGAQPGPLVPALALVAVGIGLRSWRWQRLLPGGAERVAVRRIVPVLLVGYLGNSVLPARLGEPIRAYLLARRERLSPAEVFGTAVLERIVDLATLAIMAFIAALALGAPAWVIQLVGIAALGGAAVVVVLAGIGLSPVVSRLHRLLGPRRGERVIGPLERFARGIGGARGRRGVAEATAISVPIWLTDTAICWLVGQSLAIGLALPAALLVVAVGALGTSIPSAPGYVGTYDLAASSAARAVGVTAAPALGLAVVLHAVTLIPIAAAGAISLLLIGSGGLSDLARAAESPEGSSPA